MRKSLQTTISLLLPTAAAAAASLIAMRVEVQAVGASGSETTVRITVQIAPEDRLRIGEEALIQGELTRGKRTIQRLVRTVRVADNGDAVIETQWPPGTYELRIDVESSDGQASGFWIGTVEVPRREPVAPPPTPAPARENGITDAATAAAAADADAARRKSTPEPPAAVREISEPEPPEAAPEPMPSPVPPAPAGDLGWGAGMSNLAGITVVVTDRNQPILGLRADDLRLKVDGRDTPIELAGDRSEAPLWLGLAIDASGSMADVLPVVNRYLTSFALRATGGVFVVKGEDQPRRALDWGATPTDVANQLGLVGGSDEGDLAAMVTMALAQFDTRIGRKVLLVVTDGGDVASKDGWRIAAEAAEAAGVPVMVIGFRNDRLSERTRTSLERIAASTGGRSYFLADAGLFEMTIDYLGQLVDASLALLFPRGGTGIEKLKLSTANKAFEVHHPRSIR